MVRPNCSHCIHFFITLDERKPRACRVFNIKGRSFPSVDVRRITGYECPVFKERDNIKKEIIGTENSLDLFA